MGGQNYILLLTLLNLNIRKKEFDKPLFQLYEIIFKLLIIKWER